MAKYKSIEDYRRKKRIKGFFKKSLILLVILGILFILLYVLQLYKGLEINELINKDDTKQEEQFPLTIKNEQMLDIVTFNNNIAVLTKTNILIYGFNGKKMSSNAHGFTNPVIKESNKRILTYDRGGTKFRVDNSSGKVYEITLKYNILTAQISSNGSVAVVTSHDRYSSEIILYDNNQGKETYRYSSTEEISTIDFSQDEQGLLASALVSDNGKLSTNLYELNTTTAQPAQKTMISGVIPLSVFYNENNNIKIISKDSVVTYNINSKSKTTFEYKGGLQYFVNSSFKETVLVNKNPFNKFSTVTIVSSDGKVLGSYNINDDVLDVYSDGSRIIVLCKASAYNLDMTLKELNKIELAKSTNKAVYSGENLYILGIDNVLKYKID